MTDMNTQNINETLKNAGFDIIEDAELLEKAEQIVKIMGGKISPEGLNALIMCIEDSMGENIEW
jgi:hypothetical protein